MDINKSKTRSIFFLPKHYFLQSQINKHLHNYNGID